MIGWNNERIVDSTKSSIATPVGPESKPVAASLRIAQIGVLSGLIAVGTVITNLLFGFSLPPPLYEITLAPAFYLAIAVLYPRKVSFWSTAIGSAVGEAINIFVFNEAAPLFALTFLPGIIIARAPESLIVHRFRQKSTQWVAFSMVLATVYESVAFFLIDWPVYSFTALYQPAAGFLAGFALAAFDFGTMIDVVWIPAALLLVEAVRRSFNVRFFE